MRWVEEKSKSRESLYSTLLTSKSMIPVALSRQAASPSVTAGGDHYTWWVHWIKKPHEQNKNGGTA